MASSLRWNDEAFFSGLAVTFALAIWFWLRAHGLVVGANLFAIALSGCGGDGFQPALE